MSRETGLNREKKEREKEKKRAIPLPYARGSSYSPFVFFLQRLASPPISFASSEISKAFPSYFPLFLLFVLLSRSPASIPPSISSHPLHPEIGLLSRLHPFQYLRTITHSCSRGTVINHLLDAAETMVFVRLFARYLLLLVQQYVGMA